MLPGARTTAGKLAYAAAALGVLAFVVWRLAATAGGGSREAVHMVACRNCGAIEGARKVPVGPTGAPELPVACRTCGKRAAYLAFWCPACSQALAVDPEEPPTRCPHCGASLKGMFDRPGR